MNPVAIAVMLGVLVLWVVALWAAISHGIPWLLAALVLVTLAVYLRWDRLG